MKHVIPWWGMQGWGEEKQNTVVCRETREQVSKTGIRECEKKKKKLKTWRSS